MYSSPLLQLIIVMAFIMLFVRVIVQSYHDYKKNSKTLCKCLTLSSRRLGDCSHVSTTHSGYSTEIYLSMKSLGEIDSKLGVPPGLPYNQIINILDLFIEEDGFVY